MSGDSEALLLEFATEIARDAGAILRSRFGQPHEIRFKGTIDLVTEADQAAEALIATRIREAYPAHDLLGEEGSRGAGGESPFCWVIDPLDGTTNFAHGLPTFAVSIALEEEGSPIVGVVYDPMRDEIFAARRGGGATLNGTPLRVSETSELIRSLLVTGFSYDLSVRAVQANAWRTFLTQVQAIRQTGSSAINLAYIAAGRLDGYWEWGTLPWDVAAGALLVTEAGGRITTMDGQPFQSSVRETLASNGNLHPAMLGTLAESLDDLPR
ncbi:MAG: inositol monophosphatase family protein [Thermomicrobiales bacterium]